MIQIDFDEEEAAIFKSLLEGELSDLRMEISHTDRLEFREMLKERKRVLEKAIAALVR